MKDQMLSMMTEDEFLEHAGIKGMKWGVRKSASKPTHTSADAARYNKVKSRVKKNGLDNLSNDDLAKLNKRNQLLSEYKKNNPSAFKKGSESTKGALKVLKGAGTLVTVGAAIGIGVKSARSQEGAAMAAKIAKGSIAVAKALKDLKL